MARRKLRANQVLRLLYPGGGLHRASAYQDQPPFTTPDCVNVRARGQQERRLRGGSRQGLSRAFGEQISGASNPVRLLASVSRIHNGWRDWSDSFEGTLLDSIWTQASWESASPKILADLGAAVTRDTTATGVVRDAVDSIDTSKDYSIRLFIAPWQGAHHGVYRIYARMNNTTPAAETDGIIAELYLSGSSGDVIGQLRHFSGGTEIAYAFTGINETAPQAGWFEVLVSGNNISCFWRGQSLLSSQAVGAAAGARMGFGIEALADNGVCLVDIFEIHYQDTIGTRTLRNVLVASANGELWRETRPGVMAKLTTSLSLASGVPLQAVERGQKLYIADYGERVTGTDGARGTGNDRLDAASVSDWTAHNISTADDVVELTEATGVMVNGIYTISAVASGELTLGSNCATDAGAGTATFRVMRGWKVYDPVADTLSLLTSTTGTVPHGARGITLYRDRLVAFDDPDNPHVWYMSRQGDVNDWNYGSDDFDAQRAVAGTTADAGRLGQPVRACIPHQDDYLIFGGLERMDVLRGDPASGGRIDTLSTDVGVLGRFAWAKGPEGQVVFLSRRGLYMLAPGAASTPQPLSLSLLPAEFLAIEADRLVQVLYNAKDRGFHIFLTKEDGKALSWWFDLDNPGFWLDAFDADHEPTASIEYVSYEYAGGSGVILGGKDGYLRSFNEFQRRDEAVTYSSYVIIGPIQLAPLLRERGMVMELLGVLGENSGDVTWAVCVGETGERAVRNAISNTSIASGTWSQGTRSHARQFTAYPRASGAAFCLRIDGADNNRPWTLESLEAVVRRMARLTVA